MSHKSSRPNLDHRNEIQRLFRMSVSTMMEQPWRIPANVGSGPFLLAEAAPDRQNAAPDLMAAVSPKRRLLQFARMTPLNGKRLFDLICTNVCCTKKHHFVASALRFALGNGILSQTALIRPYISALWLHRYMRGNSVAVVSMQQAAYWRDE